MARTKQTARRVEKAPKTPMPGIKKKKPEHTLTEKLHAARLMRNCAYSRTFGVDADAILDHKWFGKAVDRVVMSLGGEATDAHPDLAEDIRAFTAKKFKDEMQRAWDFAVKGAAKDAFLDVEDRIAWALKQDEEAATAQGEEEEEEEKKEETTSA